MKPGFDILICGAGVGGLAAALRLRCAGWPVTVQEQTPAPAPVGSGLMMRQLGLAVLPDPGLSEVVLGPGAPIDQMLGLAEP